MTTQPSSLSSVQFPAPGGETGPPRSGRGLRYGVSPATRLALPLHPAASSRTSTRSMSAHARYSPSERLGLCLVDSGIACGTTTIEPTVYLGFYAVCKAVAVHSVPSADELNRPGESVVGEPRPGLRGSLARTSPLLLRGAALLEADRGREGVA